MRNKKVPMRQCIVTRQTLAKKALIRIVLNQEKEIFVDHTHRANGRGVYIQPKLELVSIARKQKSFERALKTTIPEELYQALIDEITNNWD